MPWEFGGEPGNRQTNAYATVCRNFFLMVRRRSPRSSALSYVHAFNNALLNWGAIDTGDDQTNGMASGHNGRLVAEANLFFAGSVPEAIQVSITEGQGGALTVHDDDQILENLYENGATPATSAGDEIDINAAYRRLGLTVPDVTKMDHNLERQIRAEAGPPWRSVGIV